MSDNPDTKVLDYPREQFARLHARFDRLEGRHRMTSLESQVALLHGDCANQSLRIDRIEGRLDRIERRLDLVDSAP